MGAWARRGSPLPLICVACVLFGVWGQWSAYSLRRSMADETSLLQPKVGVPNADANKYGHLERVIQALQSLQLIRDGAELPTLYLITPTYARASQKADLTRMCYTLRMVPSLHWIVIEDAESKTALVTEMLDYCKVPFSHLVARTPKAMQRVICTKVNPREGCPPGQIGQEAKLWSKARGVVQRNMGLDEVRTMHPANGVVYFADDDNTYTLELFEEMRTTKKVSAWRVAYSGGMKYEGPIVKEGVVTGWHVAWRPDRQYPMDMAGFAVNAREILSHPKLAFDASAPRGFLESYFLSQILKSPREIEPRAMDCKCVLVWHTRTEAPDLKQEKNLKSDPTIVT